MRKELEVMQVLRIPPMGKLIVSVNQQRYEKMTDVREENIQHLLMAAIGELISFAGGYQKLVDAGVAPPVQPDATQKAQTAPLSEKQAAFLARLEAQRDALRTSEPPKPKFPIMSGLRPSIDDGSAHSPNIVGQIDAILQQHVAAEPSLAKRSVHLVKSPSGGLQIEVDGKIYQRPREIEDKLIQLVIKRALKEWESG